MEKENVTLSEAVNVIKVGLEKIVKLTKLLAVQMLKIPNVQAMVNVMKKKAVFVLMVSVVIIVKKKEMIVELVFWAVLEKAAVIRNMAHVNVCLDSKDFHVNKLMIKEDALVKKYLVLLEKVIVTKKLKFVNVKRDSLVMVVQKLSLNSNVQRMVIVKKMLLIKQVPVITANVSVRREEKEKIAILNKLVFVQLMEIVEEFYKENVNQEDVNV